MSDTVIADDLFCANCQGHGRLTCKDCLLVLYCGVDCQKAHWSEHKKTCKSPLIQSTWQPGWVTETRVPDFVQDGQPDDFGGKKYLWGNMPSLDLLGLAANEGENYSEDFHLLFAASGDLRNVVKTIASAPTSYTNSITAVINDKDFDIVARNAIFLLIAMVVQNQTEAVDCMIHIWYSAFIRIDHADILTTQIRPLIQDVITKIAGKASGATLGKTWTFGSRTVRLVLTKQKWESLLSYFETPHGLSAKKAQQVRISIMLADGRKDFRDRAMLSQPPVHRVCMNRFREDGMLLPFGKSREGFDKPNPTLFQLNEWPMKDSADPIQGWYRTDFGVANFGPATNDIFGRLFHGLKSVLTSFYDRTSSNRCNFQLLNVDAIELPPLLEKERFARIEVSNISDGGYLGIVQTLGYLSPLLQNPSQNPHATFLTLFMNAVEEASRWTNDPGVLMTELHRAQEYFPRTRMLQSQYDPQAILTITSIEMVRDFDTHFAEYMKFLRFSDIEQSLNMAMKQTHTVIEKWPLRLKLQPNQNGALEEMKDLLASAYTGCERYVEWKKKS